MEFQKHPYYDLELTPCGRILYNGKERNISSNQTYKRVTIYIGPGEPKTLSIHRLVAETFIGTIPNGMVINHKDGNKHNNYYTNLEIVTPKENIRHSLDNNLTKPKVGEESHFAIMKEEDILKIYGLIKMFKSNEEIAKELGTNFKQISQIRSGKKWKHLFKEHFSKPIKGINMQVPLLTALNVAADIEDGSLNLKQIADKYHLDPSTISRVVRKEIWIGFWNNIEEIKRVYNQNK